MQVGEAARRGLVLLAACSLVACADADARPPQPSAPSDLLPPGLVELEPMPTGSPPLPSELPDEVVEQLVLPPVTTEMYEVMDRLRAAAGDSPDFGGPEISLDRTRVVVRWYGDVPDAVQAVVDEYSEGEFTVVVEPTLFRPGHLQAEAARLIEEHPGVVTAVGARPAGDGIDVMISAEAVEQAGGVGEAMAADGVVSAFPLFPTSGSVVPA